MAQQEPSSGPVCAALMNPGTSVTRITRATKRSWLLCFASQNPDLKIWW
jgi:hypothetical protein